MKNNMQVTAKRQRASSSVERSTSRTRRRRNPGNESDEVKWMATIFSWLIDSQTVEENGEVIYMGIYDDEDKNGKIKRKGILCNCCNEIYTTGGFQAHAWRGINQEPYENIYVGEKYVPLLLCMAEAWQKPEECMRHKFNQIKNEDESDPYDYACMICADGGDLMCCDKCSSTYHHNCMGLEAVPEDSWYCPYCVCKFCKGPAHKNNNDYLLVCSQCEKGYHWECYKKRHSIDIDANKPPPALFCSKCCQEVYEKLKNMIGVRNDLDNGYSWTLLQRIDQDSTIFAQNLYKRIECNSKLAISWRIMKECFEPIVDRYTAIDMLQSVIYNCGSNFNRINFRNFYTAILEKDDEILSVASVRIHGRKIAEMPFIATNEIYRRMGLCRRLMTGIETALYYLKVECLVIPSIPERISSWIQSYGFCPIDSNIMEEIKCFNTLMFHDSVRLQKTLVYPDSRKTSCDQDKEVMEVENNNYRNGLGTCLKTFIVQDLNLQPPEC